MKSTYLLSNTGAPLSFCIAKIRILRKEALRRRLVHTTWLQIARCELLSNYVQCFNPFPSPKKLLLFANQDGIAGKYDIEESLTSFCNMFMKLCFAVFLWNFSLTNLLEQTHCLKRTNDWHLFQETLLIDSTADLLTLPIKGAE